ncbi:hypothetical protein AALB16_15860 [Lachnospiraceae bacterium 62-35]
MSFWCINCSTGNKDDFDFEKMICKRCGSSNIVDISGNLKIKDIFTITSISKESNFLKAMDKLYNTDIIEYELKMSQFRNQVEQQKSNQVQTNNVLKCPTCNSTKVKRISGTAKAAFGIFSKTARSQFKCENCGYKW